MRSTSVFALLFICVPLAGCSGTGGSANSLPAMSNASSLSSTSTGVSTTTGESMATSTAALPTAAPGTSSATDSPTAGLVQVAVAAALPSDFPSGASAGSEQRFTSAAWNRGGASEPLLQLTGPGATGAKTYVYGRSDGTSVTAVYYPMKFAIPTGWLGVGFGASERVPLEATYADSGKWTDTSPGIGATPVIYIHPARVTLVDLIGTGKATPTPAPTTTARSSARGTSCAHFVSNPECAQLPSSPRVSPYSNAWASLLFQSGRNRVPSFNAKVGSDPFAESQDGSDPPVDELRSGGASLDVLIACDAAAWGPHVCGSHGIENVKLHVPAAIMPAGNSDHHYAFNDDAKQVEYDFWKAQNRPTQSGQTFHVGSGGVCPWSGDGTACSGSNATNIANSIGAITEADFVRAEASSNGSFGHAISFSALCADTTFVYPANASDGSNTNDSSACASHTGTHARPPEGTRVYLDMSDTQIDAMNLPAYAKAWWRTLDRQHEGGFIADTNWSGAPGLSPAYQRDDFSQQAREAGINPVPFAQVPIGLGTINMARSIKFCANGTC